MLDATIASLLPTWPTLEPSDRQAVSRHCTAFVRRQMSLAPAHIRLGLWLLYVTFVAFAALRAAGRGSLMPKANAADLSVFASLGPASFSGLERVLRSMTMLAYLEHPSVVSAVEDDAGR